MATLPRPTKVTPSESIRPRTLSSGLLPLLPPPKEFSDPSSYPPLPATCTPFADTLPGYKCTTHLFPAAYPRAASRAFLPPEPMGRKLTRLEIKETVSYLEGRKEEAEELRTTEEAEEAVKAEGRNELLWMVAKRYKRVEDAKKREGRPLTLVALHGIGVSKETWEPIFATINFLTANSNSRLNVDEIWTVDCVQHGDSIALNESKLGDIFDSAEYSRDLTNFVLFYLPSSSSLEDPPTNLPRLPTSETSARQNHGFEHRTLVGIGHSVGACAYIYPAHAYPKLFKSLILVDSMTIPEWVRAKDKHRKYEALCMSRQFVWPNEDEARAAVKASAYYRAWAPIAVESYLKSNLRPLTPAESPTGGVRLKCHPWFESVMLMERLAVYETWELLETLDPSIPIHWVWGAKSERTGGPPVQQQTSWRRAKGQGRDSNDLLGSVGHLIPQEAPEALADCIFRFLDELYGAGKGSGDGKEKGTVKGVSKL
ncbi:hypothetical protein BOTBODRAFT_65628 [Botryobasidium botryosum FD-172 SS1]|uniref:AB hydrolase-1 domain-containing protein n=1 Tax=Botryobasidium botryosum (strain FD-172 SS1) TaxID=930990 RepID=A0A067MUM8_BOTB1|nr:hypothetical protein BOTBODRAFT_65628 [Botryobasidium botryosum FD-172 SS1]